MYQVKIISNSNIHIIQANVNEFLIELEECDFILEDIKYSVSIVGFSTTHSAMILYRELVKRKILTEKQS